MPMPDLKYARVEGVSHSAGCADAIGHPCDCGNEMFRALQEAHEELFTGPDRVPEDIALAPLAEYDVVLSAATIRMMRQALINQMVRAQ